MSDQGLTEAKSETAGDGARTGHGDLLAKNGADGEFESFERAGHAKPRTGGGDVAEGSINQSGLGVQIKETFDTFQHGGANREQGFGELDREHVLAGVVVDLNKSKIFLLLAAHANCPEIDSVAHGFDMGDGARGEEIQQARPVKWRAIAKTKNDVREVFGRAILLQLSKIGGSHSIARLEQSIEAAQALKAAGEGDVGDGHAGIGKQALGEEQSLCLPEFDGGDAEFILKNLAHVAIGDTESFGEFLERTFREEILADLISGVSRQLATDLHAAVSGRELGPAAFAGPKPGGLGGGGVAKELAILSHGRFHAANRAAVDVGGFDGDEKSAVEALVSCHDCLIELILT